VAEETGTAVVLGVPLPSLRYRTPDGRGKHVRYWAARPTTDEDAPALTARAPVTPAPRTEVDEVVWVSAATAQEMLTRVTDRAPLAVVEELWAKDRLDTHTVAVVRHGQAKRRSSHPGGERTRPLTPAGVRQATALVPVLAAFGVRHVVSSPWERCLRTVEPYAQASAAPVEVVEALTETAHRDNPKAVTELVTARLRGGEHVAISTHRPVLPAVLRALAAESRGWTLGNLPHTDPYLRTGESLVAHVTGRGSASRVVALEHHRPPRNGPTGATAPA
ncbi:MAG TPA: histidine phosphatase family protein, partial [Propionicimonas sp.]